MDDVLQSAGDCILSARSHGGIEFTMQPDGTTTCTLTGADGLPLDFVAEDDQGWNCATMGNQVCGAQVPNTAVADPATQDNPLIGFSVILIAAAIGASVARARNRR